MNAIKIISGTLAISMLSGCASMPGAEGPMGPKLVGSGQATEYGQYGEIGLQFSSVGDFVALVSPTRWKSPIATGGSLSWLNPGAWREDPGRTGRVILGEAVVVGGVAIAASGGGGGGGSTDLGGSGPTSVGPTSPSPGSPPAPPE